MKFSALYGTSKLTSSSNTLLYTSPSAAGASAQVRVNVVNTHASSTAKFYLMQGGSTKDTNSITGEITLAAGESAIKSDIVLKNNDTLYIKCDTANVLTVSVWGVEHP